MWRDEVRGRTSRSIRRRSPVPRITATPRWEIRAILLHRARMLLRLRETLKRAMVSTMPRPMKPTPYKTCDHCSTKLERKRFPNGSLESLLHFGRRKFCDQACMGKAFDGRHRADVGWSTSHYHARKLVPHGPCETCGKPEARDVHHKDGNHLNNSRENLERICRSCHSRHHRPKGSCTLCGKPQKGLGYCEKHYQRFKRHGDPLAVKVNQHHPLTVSAD